MSRRSRRRYRCETDPRQCGPGGSNQVSSEHMKRLAAIVLLVMLTALACADDRVALRRGPLGPASYRVAVTAQGRGTATAEHRSATLIVRPNANGASFTLQTAARAVIQAQ